MVEKSGRYNQIGDILAEIETDKATMEFESFYDGVFITYWNTRRTISTC